MIVLSPRKQKQTAMKFESSQVPVTTLKDVADKLIPSFGTQAALDIPTFSRDRGLYLVHQNVSSKGNRYLTYVGISRELIVEIVTGIHYSMEYLDRVTALLGDGTNYKCIVAVDYAEKTHFTVERLKSDLESRLTDYVINEHTADDMTESEVGTRVQTILNELFNHKPADLEGHGMRRLLNGYCRFRNFCKDFTDIDINL